MSGIETVIPFYGDDPLRLANLEQVKAHLGAGGESEEFGHVSCYPLWVESGESQGQARNCGVENVVSPLVLFNDADSICPFDQILQACLLAMKSDGLVFAYDLYVRRNEAGRDSEIIHSSGSMACVAISRACFEQVGGFDESYVGWGYEDLDFAQRCNALWPNRRVSGPVYHLWHGERRADDSPLDSDLEQVRANEERWRRSTA